MLEIFQWRIARDHHALNHASGNMFFDPRPNIDGGKYRPEPLQRRHGHASAGNAKRSVWFGTRKVQASGNRDADIVRRTRVDAAEVSLFKLNAFAGRINTRTHSHTVDAYSLLIGRRARRNDNRINHRVATRHAEQPDAILFGWRLQGGAHGELIAARLNLKWHDQAVPLGIPIKSEIRVIDVQTDLFVLAIDNCPGLGNELALHQLRDPFRRYFGANACRKWQINIEVTEVEARGEQNVACRDLPRLDA